MRRLKLKPLNHTGKLIARRIKSIKENILHIQQTKKQSLNRRDYWLVRINALERLKARIGYGAKNNDWSS